jgi:hypothetical protein
MSNDELIVSAGGIAKYLAVALVKLYGVSVSKLLAMRYNVAKSSKLEANGEGREMIH